MKVWSFGQVPVLLLVSFCLSACVTTVDGPDRKPASQDDRLNAHLNLGRGYLRKLDYVGARAPLEKALRTDPRSPEANVLMAILNEGEDEFDLAELRYQKALKLAPSYPMALSNYGRFLHAHGRGDEALQFLRKSVKVSGYAGRALAYQNLGLAELKAGNTEMAKNAFERALSFEAAQYVSMIELAGIAYSARDFTMAKRYYDTYSARVKQDARSLWLGIRLERIFKDVDNLASYELALKNLFPASAEYLLYKESLD